MLRRFEAPQGIAREHPWYKLIVEGKLHDGGLGATRLLVDFCEWRPTQRVTCPTGVSYD